jgi:hypothetical protein
MAELQPAFMIRTWIVIGPTGAGAPAVLSAHPGPPTVPPRPQCGDSDGHGAALTGKIAFRDLAEGPIALRLQGIETKAAEATTWGCADCTTR